MAKLELYKDNELVLSVDGKVDNDLLVFGNIVYDMINDTLIREDASFRYFLDFQNSTSEIIIKEQDYHLSEEAVSVLHERMADMIAKKDANFGNARDIRNYLNQVIERQANRLVNEGTVNKEQLLTIEAVDL